MATSVIPDLIDALVTAATAQLPSVRVYDGEGASDDPGDYLMIGVDDPDSDGMKRAATAKQSWANANHTARDEVGTITCAALSWNGNGDQKAARDGAYAITDAIENYLRTNYSLGLSTLLWTGFGPDLDLTQLQGDSGALALVVFTIAFQARI